MASKEIAGYEILGSLGEGGMGHVYRARDTTLQRDLALKVIRSTSLTAIGRERFLREARACSRISHPNIVTVYAAGEEDGRPYIAMELVSGRTLRDIIDEGKVPWQQALRWVADIADALCRLHEEGVIHRDLKPENIMITDDGLAKLMDFGIAHMASSSTLTSEGVSLGTVFYMSPEQAAGKKTDARSDIFSLASVLYEMLTGAFAFKGEHPMAVMYSITSASPTPIDEFGVELPEGLREIVERAMEKDPDARFVDGGAFRDALASILARVDPPPRGAGVLLRVVLPAGLLVAVALAVWASFLRGPNRDAAIRHNEQGVAYEEAGDAVSAREEYMKAIDADPDYADPYNNLGMLHWRQGDLPEAARLLDKNVKLNPANAAGLYNLGSIRVEMKDSTKAVLYYTLAIEADSTLLHAYNNLGDLLVRLGRLHEARGILEDALGRQTNKKFDEVVPYLLKNQGKALAGLDQPDEAYRLWSHAVEEIPNNAELHRLIAAWHEQQGDDASARKHWKQAVEFSNGDERRTALEALERIGSK